MDYPTIMAGFNLFQKKRSVTYLNHHKTSIMVDLSNKTLSQIVTDHYQTARVFEKYRLDFCCQGKRSLTVACTEKQIPIEDVLTDLYNILSTETGNAEFDKRSLQELVGYI